MLFDFHHEQDVSFWMQNTYIPLDMIFIRGDGRILRIAENTEPLSTRLIPSGPVRAVLEVIRRNNAQASVLRPAIGLRHRFSAFAEACLPGYVEECIERRRQRRAYAQSGSASGLGPEGRRFESRCPDQHLAGIAIPDFWFGHALQHDAKCEPRPRLATGAGGWRGHATFFSYNFVSSPSQRLEGF